MSSNGHTTSFFFFLPKLYISKHIFDKIFFFKISNNKVPDFMRLMKTFWLLIENIKKQSIYMAKYT